MQSEKLLPCPFCGGAAIAYLAFPQFDEGWHVECEHDNACVMRQAHGMIACGASEAAVVAEWNRRAALSQGQDGAVGVKACDPRECICSPDDDPPVECPHSAVASPSPAQEAGAEPVAWRWCSLKGWVTFHDKDEADKFAAETGALLQPLYRRSYTHPPHRGDWEKAVEAGVRAGIKALNDREPTRDHPTYQHAFVDAALTAAAPYMVPEGWSVERLAQWLHDEVEWPDPDFPHHSWPEHPDDTGQRGDGWLKIIPKDTQEQFRDIARRMLATSPNQGGGDG